MDEFQLKQIVTEAVAKHAKPGQAGSKPAAIAVDNTLTLGVESTEEVKKLIHEEAASQGLKFVAPVPPP